MWRSRTTHQHGRDLVSGTLYPRAGCHWRNGPFGCLHTPGYIHAFCRRQSGDLFVTSVRIVFARLQLFLEIVSKSRAVFGVVINLGRAVPRTVPLDYRGNDYRNDASATLDCLIRTRFREALSSQNNVRCKVILPVQ